MSFDPARFDPARDAREKVQLLAAKEREAEQRRQEEIAKIGTKVAATTSVILAMIAIAAAILGIWLPSWQWGATAGLAVILTFVFAIIADAD